MSAIVASPPVTADVRPGPGWRTSAAIARVEGRRLIRRPIFGFGAGLSVALFVFTTWSRAPVMHRDDTWVSLSLIPVAVATYLATNFAATRARRTGTEELLNAQPVPAVSRTSAHLLALAWPLAAAIALTIADVGYLKLIGGVWSPSPQEVATGPMLVLVLGAFGVLVARVAPSAIAGSVGLIGLAAVQLLLMRSGLDSGRFQQRWSAFWLNFNEAFPRELFFRPAGWHLLYLAGVGGVAAAAARLRHGATLGRVVCAVAAIALVWTGVWGQSRPVGRERELVAERVAAREPQVCENHGGVRYCAYRAYAPWIARWRSVVEGTFKDMPSVRPGLVVSQKLKTIFEDTQQSGEPQEPGVIPMTSLWGARFKAGVAELSLATRAASWAVGLPAVPQNFVVRWTAEDVREYVRKLPGAQVQPGAGIPTSVPGTEIPTVGTIKYQGSCTPAGQARSIVALWLAGRSSPDAANALWAALADHRYGILTYEDPSGAKFADLGQPSLYFNEWPFAATSNVEWGIAEAHYAGQLLERPATEVAALLREHWSTLTDPETKTADAIRILRLKPLPTLDEQLRAAGITKADFIKRLTPGSELEKANATLHEDLESALYSQNFSAACP